MNFITKNRNVLLNILKAAVFGLVFVFAVMPCLRIFGVKHEYIYDTERRIREETRNTLDGVYIGSSNAFCFFAPPVLWEEYGYSVILYSIPALPADSIKYKLIEARKYQKDALYIINLNPFKSAGNITNQVIHYLSNYMPLSLNKLQMINSLSQKRGNDFFSSMEYYFPIIRFHSRWTEFVSKEFTRPEIGLKGAIKTGNFLKKSTDFSDTVFYPDAREPLTDAQLDVLNDLLDYIEKENVRVLFVTTPQMRGDGQQGTFHALEDYLTERGYDCLPLTGSGELTGIQADTDYSDHDHTNVHGALKFTHFLGNYLSEHYDFTDKRNQPGWESWDKSVELFYDIISPWTLDIERMHSPRDYSLNAPASLALSGSGTSALLSWKPVEGADGYAVFRKYSSDDGKNWQWIGDTGSGQTTYSDESLEKGVSYTYTVVPYSLRDGEKYYGKFSYSGVKAAIK